MIEIQFGAGGVVTQPTPTGPWFIGIHHRKHDEWSLPKGTWKPGETLEETALRGVEEETGFSLRFAGTAGLVHYLKPGTLQPVLFWIMVPEGHNRFTPSKEVDRFERFPLSQAVDRLGFAEEKELVTQALAQPSPNLSKEDNERLRARLEDECHQTRRLTPDGSGEP
ncbi:MAG: NUDIX domain-containing protein, partial [Nitrospinaceae bacterium]|nr:NUDIX domain-containing protein [Nitrospinaceae bacterium]NIS85461.1 NUDIX domain-containing protein [Nitrospinaceae bacterium]NIT82295.1 NUDIX domain-containing protein [Nitrospinaceae bacterium]NIU96665.1 NUDIX domain-containing protein [Nitrospinaceae bacterium]NIY15514.1 NUDIX domain-containing protein [Nitrospinaceae bacterium]